MSAIQIYRYNECNRRYAFDINAFKEVLFTSQNNEVAIYSINGPLREGKSFMLSLFVKYLQNPGNDDWISAELPNPFVYKAGTDRQTTGIWMWSKPFMIERNGKKTSVFLLDTQGFFDDQTSLKENAIIFGLSCLLSSVMIFNIMKKLDESKLQFLQYFAGFARLADEDNRDEPFQRLVFLIRDWEFPNYECGYYDDNHSINDKNFKKDYLDVNDRQPLDVKFVHESILSTFDNVSSYLMTHPGPDLARESRFDLSTVDKDFVAQVKEFVPKVLKDEFIRSKKIGGRVLTGKELSVYAEKWAEIFRSDKIPEMKNVFQASAEVSNEMAKSAAIDNYRRKIRRRMNGKSDQEFANIHRTLFDESIKLFKSFKRLGGNEFEIKYLPNVIECLNKLNVDYLALNKMKRESNEAKEKCHQLTQDIEENLQLITDLRDDQKKERKRYEKQIETYEKMLKQNSEQMYKMEEEMKAMETLYGKPRPIKECTIL